MYVCMYVYNTIMYICLKTGGFWNLGWLQVFFSDLWDWRAGADSLHVLYELWMNAPKMHAEAVEVFQESRLGRAQVSLVGVFQSFPGWVCFFVCLFVCFFLKCLKSSIFG